MLDTTLNIFRAVGEETRLRIAVLLSRGELTVTELTQILAQSQPRVSRHLKILADAGLVERFREGAWVFYRIAGSPSEDTSMQSIRVTLNALSKSSDRVLARDRERFVQSRQARAAIAADYFDQNAKAWDQVRRLHLPDSDIESQMLAMLGYGGNGNKADRFDPAMRHDQEKIGLFLDLGTGTGRILEIFSQIYEQGVGYDASREMLSVARANLDAANVQNAQVRYGDIFALPATPETADLICIHQVLHFLTEPGNAVCEAARLLRPGARLIISDFAPHDLEFLREDHAHRRLGFGDDEVRDWCRRANLNFISTKTLSPLGGEKRDQLTVKIWLCARPAKSREGGYRKDLSSNVLQSSDL